MGWAQKATLENRTNSYLLYSDATLGQISVLPSKEIPIKPLTLIASFDFMVMMHL